MGRVVEDSAELSRDARRLGPTLKLGARSLHLGGPGPLHPRDGFEPADELTGGAVARVSASPLESLVITDSIQATEAVRVSQTVRQLSIAPLLAEAMARISEEKSVSSLFD